MIKKTNYNICLDCEKKHCLLIPDESTTISISTFSWKKISYYCVFRCNAKTEKNMKKIKAKILY